MHDSASDKPFQASPPPKASPLRRALSFSRRIWPYIHLPIALFLASLWLWKAATGYELFPPKPASLIHDMQHVIGWDYFLWHDHPSKGPRARKLTPAEREILFGKPSDPTWNDILPPVSFAASLRDHELIDERNMDPRLADRVYSKLLAHLRPRVAPSVGDWGHGIVVDSITHDGELRTVFVIVDHVSTDGADATGHILVFTGTDGEPPIVHRQWLFGFADLDDNISVVELWLMLIMFTAVPIWLVIGVVFMARAFRAQYRFERHACERCGYSRDGLGPARCCPECGTMFAEPTAASCEDVDARDDTDVSPMRSPDVVV